MRALHLVSIALALVAAVLYPVFSPAKDAPRDAAAIHAELEEGATALMAAGCTGPGCHAGRYPKTGLDLSAEAFPASVVGVESRKAEGWLLVDPADPSASYLLAKIVGEPGIVGERMPIKAPPMPASDVALLRLWLCGVYATAGGDGK